MTNAIATTEDEEGFLLQQLLDARHALEVFKKESSSRKFTQNTLEKQLADIEQAMLDYCNNNGLNQFESGHCTVTIGDTESVEVPDVDALPEMFQRIKTTKEPNKVLIKELRPDANWYSIKQSQKITVTTKGL